MTFNPNAPRSAAYPNQRRANDPILSEMIKASVSFWHARGVNVTGVPFDVADNISEPGSEFAYARGFDKKTYGDSRVVLDSRQVGMRLKRIKNKRLDPDYRRQQIYLLGQVIAHELGHAGGLGHTPGGLMGAQLSEVNTPEEIKQLANHLVRGRSKKSRTVRREDF